MLGTTHWITPTEPSPLCMTTRSLVVVTEPNVTALNVLSAAHTVLYATPDTEAVFLRQRPDRPGVADALREAGRQVPDDVALVGYDNWEIFASTTRPPLTSVDMCLKELGQLAARELLDAIDERPSHGLRRLPCRLVIRESTGPVRRPAPGAGASVPAPPPSPGTAAAPAAS